MLRRPYWFAVYKVFSRRVVSACHLGIVIAACFIFATAANWLFHAVTSSSSAATYRELSTQTSGGPNEVVLNYGVVIDCGSSGSRGFVYFWPPHTGEPHQLLNIQLHRDSNGNPAVMKTEPGLSSYVNNPSEASEHVAVLLRYAAALIPKEKHGETPVYIMATAGLRLLDARDQEAILSDLRVDLALQFDFLFSATHVEVISGKQEGVYSWIAVNHALGKFDHFLHSDDELVSVDIPSHGKHIRKQTVGMLDLGGASLQIAFELPDKHSAGVDKNLLAEFNLGCSSSDFDHHYRIYVATYLGLGSNEARYRYEIQLLATLQRNSSAFGAGIKQQTVSETILHDVCLPVGRSEHISRGNLSAIVRGIGSLERCRQKLLPLLNVSQCSSPAVTCAPDGFERPSFSFTNNKFYGFSEFYYTMEDLLRMGGKYNSVRFQLAAQNYCATNWSLIEKWHRTTAFPRADYNRYRLQCFKSAWIMTILHNALGFPLNYHWLTSADTVRGQQVHWTLGALLYKTKYFPLRDMERHKSHDERTHTPWLSQQDNYYQLLLLCVVVILIICVVYARSMWRTSAALHRVPTMSYYMLDTDSSPSSVHIHNSRSYSQFLGNFYSS